ncbi:hypothetical protein MJO28_001317 [Puccinia striiformis f. sp. tritici]|uniref:Uncharacterized protein n=1 Tax=Puccinia striiformis f. sp. tritici TaxID=168172 RepID=A0ACC0EVC3_9BASI|nr:hypothetical protein MJO28_001317 [Puccinia striiformis f. sp. tritici]
MYLSTRLLLAHLGLDIAGNALGYPTHDSLSPISFDWNFESPNLDDLLFSKLIPEPEAQHIDLPISAPPLNSQLPSSAGFGLGNTVDHVPNGRHLGSSLASAVSHDRTAFRPGKNYIRDVMQTRNTVPVDHDLPHLPRYEHEAPGSASYRDSQEKFISHILQRDGIEESIHPPGTWRRHKENDKSSVGISPTPTVQSLEIPPTWVTSPTRFSRGQGLPTFDTRAHAPPSDGRYGSNDLPSYSQLLELISPKRPKLTDHFMDSQTRVDYPSEWPFLDNTKYTELSPMGDSDPLHRSDHWQRGFSSRPGVNSEGEFNSERQLKNKMIELADKSRYRTGYLSDLVNNFKSHTKSYASPREKKTEIFKFDLEAFENNDALGLDKAKIDIIRKLIEPNGKLTILELGSFEVHKKFFHKLTRFQSNKKKPSQPDRTSRVGDRRNLLHGAFQQLWSNKELWYRLWGDATGIAFQSIHFLPKYQHAEAPIEKNLLLLLFMLI